ncbi:MAG TPA: glycosyl hydrolase family protein [Actinocrinis sp.]|nr:glycosyl hydrolase family protein [Actinocrinis sp.]
MSRLQRCSGTRGRSRSVAGLATAALTLAATAAVTTTANATTPAATPAADPVISISSTPFGTSLAQDSPGLSYEASDLALPGFTGGNLAAYLKTLGTSVIRIGGNTVDETFWTSTGQAAPSWSIATITPADLTALGTLTKASGWKVILGVNMKHYDTAAAADEAAHAVAALGTSLQAIEIGNEPDDYSQYSSNTAQYFTDFQAYVAAIEKAAPGVAIEGDDNAAAPNGSWQNAFVANEQTLAKPDISELTNHYYPRAACGGTPPTIADLLSLTSHNNETSTADDLVAAAAKLKVPGVLDEGNSVVCEGQDGVSNVFAAALWEIDDQLLTAREGVAGDYEHGTVIQCDSGKPLFMYYTPLCAPTAADATAGLLAAQPEYYGLAAVHDVGTGKFLTVTNPDSSTVHAYSVQHPDGTMTVVLDDIQDPASNGSSTLQLDLGATYTSGQKVSLTASGLSATSGITLGGQSVQSNGALPAPTAATFSVSGATTTVTIPAGSAEILTFSGVSAAGTTLVGGLSGKCLSVTGGSTAGGATADIYTCDGSGSQNWTAETNGEIVGALSGKCLEVAGSSTADQAGVDINACTGAADQKWTVNAGGTIVGAQSGKCLSVTGAATANSALADIYDCNGSGSETWTEK